ncbi:hypothetical protein N0V93_006032 [Gnomoniopsis smithogilvyi]|uniref:Uncharacterized protein n=1 Tax=Gnomoniopsis smithogilvyi TaxID=1191159 RepID=A0A9W8YNL5_9PEZI|nr:hypothetical protein N0V93_006032 [Gnomoniopsis smithogilvyi]
MGRTSSSVTIIQQNEQPPPNPPVAPPPNFMSDLFNQLNQLISNPITVTGNAGVDTQTLRTALKNYTFVQFQQQFGYLYAQQQTIPPNSISPAKLQALDDFINVAADDPAAITQYITNIVMGSSSFPKTVNVNASSDLNTVVQTFLNGGISNGWLSQKYHHMYTSSTDKTEWAIDAVFTFTVVKAVDYAQKTPSSKNTLFMQFAGVTYQTA